jgi:pyrroloquinoline quinone biosynthesis protein B
LRVIVLGSAAGGGVPQWNCRCRICALAWDKDARVKRRTQSSLAVTINGEEFVLINASPDLREQIAGHAVLQPRSGLRGSPVRACVVTNADVDHIAGLLTLRERQNFDLYATQATLSALQANPIFDVLAPECVARKPVRLDEAFEPLPGLVLTPFAAPGKVALWQERENLEIGVEGETTVALELRCGSKRILYVPACAAATTSLREKIAGADVLLFDGTTFTDDELIAAGLMQKSARRMGHLPMSGRDGSAASLAGLDVGRKIFIHINNSNPVLIEDSPERRWTEQAGWEIAYDGMEIVL